HFQRGGGMVRIADEQGSSTPESIPALVKRISELEERIAQLQRENIDLIMKNRVLAEVSARDSLTGLYNRWYVMEKIESEMNRALRHGSPMSVLMLDLDHFKSVND